MSRAPANRYYCQAWGHRRLVAIGKAVGTRIGRLQNVQRAVAGGGKAKAEGGPHRGHTSPRSSTGTALGIPSPLLGGGLHDTVPMPLMGLNPGTSWSDVMCCDR